MTTRKRRRREDQHCLGGSSLVQPSHHLSSLACTPPPAGTCLSAAGETCRLNEPGLAIKHPGRLWSTLNPPHSTPSYPSRKKLGTLGTYFLVLFWPRLGKYIRIRKVDKKSKSCPKIRKIIWKIRKVIRKIRKEIPKIRKARGETLKNVFT